MINTKLKMRFHQINDIFLAFTFQIKASLRIRIVFAIIENIIIGYSDHFHLLYVSACSIDLHKFQTENPVSSGPSWTIEKIYDDTYYIIRHIIHSRIFFGSWKICSHDMRQSRTQLWSQRFLKDSNNWPAIMK